MRKLLVLDHPGLCLLYNFLIAFVFSRLALAQQLNGGQVFTNGLAIINNPTINSQLHAGSDLGLSIEVSGDGKLQPKSFTPGSTEPNRYDFMEIYLVSAVTNLNLTVTTSILPLEGSSTVKHPRFQIPSCIPAGPYNLTVYEASHINDQPFFAITPIPLTIDNNNPSGACSGNTLLSQPQVSSPSPQNPFLASGFLTSTTGRAQATAGSNPPAITIVISGSGPLPFDFPPTVTVTNTAPTSTVTVVYESFITMTTVSAGPTNSVTVTITSTSLQTRTMIAQGGNFVPVNSATVSTATSIFLFLTMTFAFGVSMVLL